MGTSEQDIRSHLKAGENMLWFGRPAQAIAHPRRNIKDIAILLLVIAGLVGVRTFLQEAAVLRVVTLLFILVLCGILFVIWVVEPFAEKKRFLGTAYAITTERAIVMAGKQVFAQALDKDTLYRLSGTSPQILEIWSHAVQAPAEKLPMRFLLANGVPPMAILERRLGNGTPAK